MAMAGLSAFEVTVCDLKNRYSSLHPVETKKPKIGFYGQVGG